MPPPLALGPDLGSGLGPLVAGVERIAVLRANLLGDLVMTLPALEALRSAYPSAELVLLGTPMHAELLAGRPGTFADRVVVVPAARGVRSGEEDPGALDAFFARMSDERFDLGVQLHGGGRWSNPFLRRVGAGTTVGLRAADAPPLDRDLPYLHFQHEVVRLLEVVGLVGAAPVMLAPRLPVTEADRAAARPLLADGSDRPLLVVHPGARDPRRRWPAERFAAVADQAVRRGAQVVVTGTPAERATADRVVSAMAEDARVAADLSLSALVGLLSRASAVLANDTGPRHLAEAVGTPTVGLFWCGNVGNAAPLTRSRHRIHVSWRLECPRCGVPKLAEVDPERYGEPCDHREPWLTDVPVPGVVRDVLELLAGSGEGTAA